MKKTIFVFIFVWMTVFSVFIGCKPKSSADFTLLESPPATIIATEVDITEPTAITQIQETEIAGEKNNKSNQEKTYTEMIENQSSLPTERKENNTSDFEEVTQVDSNMAEIEIPTTESLGNEGEIRDDELPMG